MTVLKSLPVPDRVPVRAVGLACLDDELFVLRDRWVNQIEVYSTKTSEDYHRLRQFSLLKLQTHSCNDMTACARHRCLYVSDWTNKCVHKSSPDGKVEAPWPISDHPCGQWLKCKIWGPGTVEILGAPCKPTRGPYEPTYRPQCKISITNDVFTVYGDCIVLA